MKIGRSVVKKTLRQQIKIAESNGQITFTDVEFRQLIGKLDRAVQTAVGSAYTTGYINAP